METPVLLFANLRLVFLTLFSLSTCQFLLLDWKLLLVIETFALGPHQAPVAAGLLTSYNFFSMKTIFTFHLLSFIIWR